MKDILQELERRRDEARLGGGLRRIDAQHKRGKLTARERIELLVDEGSFEEFDMFVAHRSTDFGMQDERPYGDGVVTGWGTINGRMVYVFSQDFTVFGGSLSETHAQKICKIMDMAMQNGAPLIGINDSGGARIQEGVASLAGYADVFQRNIMASGVIPQISVIMGPCAGGAVYSPAMTDFIFMVRDTSYMFVTGPDVVKTVTNEVVTAEDLGGGRLHAERSGVVDHLADDDDHALQIVRDIVSTLPAPPRTEAVVVRDPGRPATDLYDLVPLDVNRPYDVRDVIACLIDGEDFHEFKSRYGTTLVTGFARIHGHLVGIVANNGVLFSESSLKGAHFIELCDQRGVPLVFLQNISGFMVGSDAEAGGIAKDGAKMVTAVATTRVPKLTVVIGGSFGAGNYSMCGRASSPRFLWSWPGSRISVMGGRQAAAVLATVREDAMAVRGEEWTTDEREAFEAPIRSRYEEQGDPYYATARLWDDGIIDPADTRDVLGLALDVVTRVPLAEPRLGLFRM